VQERLVVECGLPRMPMPRPRQIEISPGQFVWTTEYIVLKIRMADVSAGVLDTDDLNVAIVPSREHDEDDGSHTLISLGDNALTKLVRACFEAGA
jgi:hypothetical protein